MAPIGATVDGRPSLVLVTGASGFIAAWVVKIFLERGWAVRGTVRSPSKGEYLKNLFKEYGDKFTYVIVEDIATEGAFDEAVKGVDAVAHTASPATFTAVDPDVLIKPAVNGTLGVLKSVKDHAPTVKRIVITSSGATLMQPHDPPYHYTELDWNTYAVEQVEQFGAKADGVIKYRASKTLAERATWKFVKENQPSYDVVTIIPPFVFGPIIHEVSSPDSLGLTPKWFYDNVLALVTNPTLKSQEQLKAHVANVVDVRDVARAHVEVLSHDKAGNERFIISTGPFVIQDVLDALNSANPPLPFKFPAGSPGAGKSVAHPRFYDPTKSKKVLGFVYMSFEDTVRDMAVSLYERFH